MHLKRKNFTLADVLETDKMAREFVRNSINEYGES